MPNSHDKLDLGEFVILLPDHPSLMRSYITQLIPNASDVHDVLQITNVALWEKRGDYTLGTNFKARAMAVTRDRAMEHRKKMKRDRVLIFDDELIETLDQEFDEQPENTEHLKIVLEVRLGKLKPRDANIPGRPNR